MKIIFDLGHPAHFHLFKNAITILKHHGHEVVITARDKEILLDLLNLSGIPYRNLGKSGKNVMGLGIELIRRDILFFSIVKAFKPDILVGVSEIITHIGKIFNIPAIVFTDTEHAKLSNMVMFPLASVICTPSCYIGNIGKKHLRYNGFHELAYLHPNHFTPNIAVLDEIGLTIDATFIIVRFVSFQASHDVGHHGIRDKVGLVRALEPYGRILITSEGPLPQELEEYRIQTSPDKMHDLLSYATMYIGEGATMASEAALVGTPSILISSLVGTMGNFIELEKKYDLMYSFSDAEPALHKALEILQDPQNKRIWAAKLALLLRDKIDVTDFIVRFIENYPQSSIEMNEH